jgi:hypothetical protein
MRARGRWLVTLLGVCGFLAFDATPASAHPSDFDTLTIDLLLTPRGVEVIDAALVAAPGPSYLPLPSEDDRRNVAGAILDTLGIKPSRASIDAARSERYHENGFTIRLTDGFSNAGRGELQLETGRLQEIAAARRLSRLKVAVCDASAENLSTILSALTVDVSASRPGRGPDPNPSRGERADCTVWDIAPNDAPVRVRARVVPLALASTGGGQRSARTATVLICIGLALSVAARRLRVIDRA